MSTAIQTKQSATLEVVSSVILRGDLSSLTPQQKVHYYREYCERLDLDPVTKPFEILKLQGKEVLYCTRAGTQQLANKRRVSHAITARDRIDDLYVVICRASLPDGRSTEAIGAVPIAGLKGEGLANAMMKAETKAKRRATLDLVGLGIMDESETDSIPGAQRVAIDLGTPESDGKLADAAFGNDEPPPYGEPAPPPSRPHAPARGSVEAAKTEADALTGGPAPAAAPAPSPHRRRFFAVLDNLVTLGHLPKFLKADTPVGREKRRELLSELLDGEPVEATAMTDGEWSRAADALAKTYADALAKGQSAARGASGAEVVG